MPSTTGRGSVRVQAKAHTEQIKGNRTQIVVTEIPYQVNKSYLLQKIAELVKDRKLQDISDLRDESDRNGMRIVIELKREAVPKVVLNNLYKHTQMQQSFGVNLVALVDGVPKTLSYRQAPQALRRPPVRRGDAQDALRAGAGEGESPHPRRPPDSPRQPRRGRCDHPAFAQRGDGAEQPDQELQALRAPGAGDPRPQAAAAHRDGAPEGRARAQGPEGEDRIPRKRPRRRVEGVRDREGGARRGQGGLQRRAHAPPSRPRRAWTSRSKTS